MEIKFYDEKENLDSLIGSNIYCCGLSVNRLNGSIIYIVKPMMVIVKKVEQCPSSIKTFNQCYLVCNHTNDENQLINRIHSHMHNMYYFSTLQECREHFKIICDRSKKDLKQQLELINNNFNKSIEICTTI